MRADAGVGTMRERIEVEQKAWPSLVVTIARVGLVATITAVVDHDWQSGDYVTIAGASPSDYNGVKQVTVTGDMTATFAIGGSVTTPATGTITATFLEDAQGFVRESWVLLALMPAAVAPLSAQERLAQPPALMTTRFIRFMVRNIAGLSEQQRVKWTPVHPPESPEQVLQITGVLPVDDGRRFLFLECVGP